MFASDSVHQSKHSNLFYKSNGKLFAYKVCLIAVP